MYDACSPEQRLQCVVLFFTTDTTGQDCICFQVTCPKELAESMVTLENCSVNEQVLHGTVRVRNISFQKDVRVRITFDSWQSYRDVPWLCLPAETLRGPSDRHL
ncbi:hypothetical protein NQZ68_027793 [Dissostichus eleginoides]|nr:hypothetical protein NQZ68_027793 [Dissostichus eleginoides]